MVQNVILADRTVHNKPNSRKQKYRKCKKKYAFAFMYNLIIYVFAGRSDDNNG